MQCLSSPGRSGLQPGDRSDSLKGLSQQLRIGRRELAMGDSPLVVKLRMSLDSFAPGSDDAGLEDAFQGAFPGVVRTARPAGQPLAGASAAMFWSAGGGGWELRPATREA